MVDATPPAANQGEHHMSTVASETVIPTGTWEIDPAHSSIGFAVKHLGITTVRGSFGTFKGTLTVGEALATAQFGATIDAASVTTSEPQRDAHLRSPDFFDVERYPTLEFVSTGVTPLDADRFTIRGTLAMHGVAQPVELIATVQGTETDPWGNQRVGLEISGELSRAAYGIAFNQVLGSGNLAVSDKVKLSLDVSAVRQAA
jgi:polyisoprenoid-binding protein YceI